jgi:hypothetical protein
MSESTSKPCIHGHTSGRYANGTCGECARIRRALYRAEHPDKIKAYNAKYYAENSTREIARSVAYSADNPDKVKAWNATYRTRHPERVKAVLAAWYAQNPDRPKTLELTRSGHCPAWADFDAIQQVYLDRAELDAVDPVSRFEVDHILPLNGKTVSGLHVAANLQVIPGAVNGAKHNRVLNM